MKRSTVLLIAATAFLATTFLPHFPAAAAAEFPAKGRAITIIVPFAAGGGTDVAARLLAALMEKDLGVPVQILNKPGAGSQVGVTTLATSKPDGYTIGITPFPHTMTTYLDPVRKAVFNRSSFEPVGAFFTNPVISSVGAQSPYKTLKDVIAEAKNNPQNLKYASLAGTTSIELAIRQFFDAIGADITKTKAVLCDGGAAVVTLTAGGHVSLGSAGTSGWLPSIKAGTVKPLFITSGERNPLLPDVPTSAEVGLPSVTATNWFGISGPPKLPANVVEAWDTALKDMVKDQAVIAQFKNIGAVPMYMDGQQLRKFITDNLQDLRKFWK